MGWPAKWYGKTWKGTGWTGRGFGQWTLTEEDLSVAHTYIMGTHEKVTAAGIDVVLRSKPWTGGRRADRALQLLKSAGLIRFDPKRMGWVSA